MNNNNRTELSVLVSAGDIKVTWDYTDPASITQARAEVEALRLAGYTFFLVDGSPADEVAAAGESGALNARRVSVDELLAPTPEEMEIKIEEAGIPAGTPEIKDGPNTGRNRKNKRSETQAQRQAVAVPRQRGG